MTSHLKTLQKFFEKLSRRFLPSLGLLWILASLIIALELSGVIRLPLNSMAKNYLLLVAGVGFVIHCLNIANYTKLHSKLSRLTNLTSLFASFIAVLSLNYLLLRTLVISQRISNELLMSFVRFETLPLIALVTSILTLFILPTSKEKITLSLHPTLEKLLIWTALIGIIVMGAALRIYQVGSTDFVGDEFQVINAAAGFLYTGDFYRWDWIDKEPFCLEKVESCYYDRAWPHTLLVALSFGTFGVSEFSARLPSVAFGVLTILISYFVSLYFTKNKLASLFLALLVSISPAYISLSRYVRMYIVLLPLFLLLTYLGIRTLSESFIPKSFGIIGNLLKKLLPIHWPLAGLALILLVVNYYIHINSLVIVPALMLFSFLAIALVKKRERYKWIIIATISFVGFLLVAILLMLGVAPHQYFLTFFEKNNTAYFNHMFSFPFGMPITFFLVIIASITAFLKRQLQILSLAGIVFFGLIFFIFIADRYAAFVYTSHLTLLVIILSVVGLITLLSRLNRFAQIAMVFSIGLFMLFTVSLDTGNRYHQQGSSLHSQAYQIIEDNYDYGQDTLFLQYGRLYYLRDLTKAKRVSMMSNQQYAYEQFLIDIYEARNGWVAWETGKSYHLQPAIIDFIDSNLEKVHGEGIDLTRVEVYKFDESMLPSLYGSDHAMNY